jgi:hypothetical protein
MQRFKQVFAVFDVEVGPLGLKLKLNVHSELGSCFATSFGFLDTTVGFPLAIVTAILRAVVALSLSQPWHTCYHSGVSHWPM